MAAGFRVVKPADDSRLAHSSPVVSAGLATVQRLRLALRMESQSDPVAEDLQVLNAIPPSEQWLAACRWNRWRDFTNWTALADSARVNACLAAGRIDEFFKSELPQDPLQRLVRLVEIAEHYPAWRETAQCLAESLTEGTNCPPGGRKLLARLAQDRAWVPLPVTPVSAGLRPIQVSSDFPQDPALRLRRALLPPAGTNQFTLSSRSAFTAAMTLQNPARLELRAELVGVGFSSLTPLTVSLQIDADEALPLALTPAETEARTNFTLLAGSHLVRMRIEDPAVNQLVRVSLSGRSEEGTNIFWSRSLAEAAAERRFFHIATPAQPVRFSWNGPAVLRIDEWREGQFCSQVRFVGGGEQTVEIPVAPGRTDSFYQVFVRTTETNQPRPRVVFNPREPDEVLPPKLHLRESTPPFGAQLTDYYRPGGQEDGTWTPGLLFAHRRPFEISDALDAVDNEFVEANVVYRKVNQDETLWFRTEGLARAHRPGDLTLGMSERIEGRPRNLPFEWSWSGEAFAGTTGPDREDVQGSLYTQLEIKRRIQLNRKLDWVPFASLFAHYLSLDPETAAQYDYIDQDLYTLFREEHRWGGILGNRLEYRPWLDTYLKAGLALKSNEDFGLDDWGMRFSWTQLVGAFRGEVAYQFQSFLEDSDRSSDAFRQGVSAGLYYEHWFSGRHRMEIGMQCRHDWPDAGNSYFLALRWDLGNGRGYRDYSPDEMIFRDLRSRRIPPAYNNLLEADSPAVNRQ